MLEVYYRVNSARLMFEEMDGEVVVIHQDTGVYYNLESVAADIWRELQTGASLPDLAARLASRYVEAPETIREMVAPFLAQMLELGLVVETSAPPPA